MNNQPSPHTAPQHLPPLEKGPSLFPIQLMSFIQFLIWLAIAFAMIKFVPELKEMFEEFEIELPGSAQFTIAWSDRIIKFWFVLLVLIPVLTGLSFCTMYVARRRSKKLFRWISIGLVLLPGLLFLFFVISVTLPILWIQLD